MQLRLKILSNSKARYRYAVGSLPFYDDIAVNSRHDTATQTGVVGVRRLSSIRLLRFLRRLLFGGDPSSFITGSVPQRNFSDEFSSINLRYLLRLSRTFCVLFLFIVSQCFDSLEHFNVGQ